jgi:hypothetical protein
MKTTKAAPKSVDKKLSDKGLMHPEAYTKNVATAKAMSKPFKKSTVKKKKMI